LLLLLPQGRLAGLLELPWRLDAPRLVAVLLALKPPAW
jgi:hypothetical protein